MRVRTTWNEAEIAKRASMPKQADPYLMNQDHVKQQPKADDYVIGGPSEFAEDVSKENRWETEYKGGEVARNEIGMPEMRPETFSHSEKAAALDEALLIKKADLTVRVARMMLGSKATEASVEDQALALMYVPDQSLIETYARLASDDQDEGEGQDQQQAKQAGEMPPQFKENAEKKKEEAKAKKEEGGQAQAKQAQAKQAQDQDKVQQQDQDKVQQQDAQQVQTKQANQDKVQQQDAQQGQDKQANQQCVQALQQAMQAGDMQGLQAAIAQMMQQTMRAQQQAAPQQPMQQQAAPQQPMQQQADDMVLDELLGMPADLDDDMGVQLDAAPMDVGEVVLGSEDDVLKTLFANNEETQAAQDAQQGKQASVRTASTRTLGTKPSVGVSKIGGTVGVGASAPGDVDKLASLWTSAPDVRDAFGIK